MCVYYYLLMQGSSAGNSCHTTQQSTRRHTKWTAKKGMMRRKGKSTAELRLYCFCCRHCHCHCRCCCCHYCFLIAIIIVVVVVLLTVAVVAAALTYLNFFRVVFAFVSPAVLHCNAFVATSCRALALNNTKFPLIVGFFLLVVLADTQLCYCRSGWLSFFQSR